MTQAICINPEDALTELSLAVLEHGSLAEKDFKVNSVLLKLLQSNWFTRIKKFQTPLIGLLNVTKPLLLQWKKEIKSSEQIIASNRRNALNPDNQVGVVLDTEIVTDHMEMN